MVAATGALTVTGRVANFFTVTGRVGQIIAGLFLTTEDGSALTLESGDTLTY